MREKLININIYLKYIKPGNQSSAAEAYHRQRAVSQNLAAAWHLAEEAGDGGDYCWHAVA